jgi:hypothetical protein
LYGDIHWRKEIKNNLFRIILSVIFALGWTFSTASQAEPDPLIQAYEDIQELQSDINKLNDKAKTQELLDIAIDKYNYAVQSKYNLEESEQEYDTAVEQESLALEAKTLALSAVDGQTVTVATALEDKDQALQDKNDAQDQLDIANINLQTAQIVIQNAGNAGLQYTVYYLARGYNGEAITNGIICTGVWNSNSMNLPVCGRYEDFIVRFTGKITVPDHWTTTYFAGYTDDGFRMYVDGQLAINNWQEQGATWSPYSPVYDVSVDKTLDVEIWWYNGGGPGSYHLGWAIPGGWTGAGCDYTGGWGVGFSCNLNTFSYGEGATQAQIDAYNQAVSDQAQAQQDYNSMVQIYNNKLSYYNEQNSILLAYQQTLSEEESNLTQAQENLTIASENLTQDQNEYEVSIPDMQQAILNAQTEYNKQWQFEESQRVAAAIAQAIANQPQPTPEPEPTPTPEESTQPTPEPTPEIEPEPSIEPSPEPTPNPEPSPEQTEPDFPNPQPTDQTGDESSVTPDPEPEISPEPQPEPTPQQTDIDPLPTPSPQPEKSPVAPSPKPSPPNNTTIDLTSVIANLTSKDNIIVKLTPEQMSAVGQSLTTLAPEAKVELAKDLGVKTDDIAILAEEAQDNPAVAAAIVTFAEKAEENADAPMPYTIADAITEAAAELFLEDPLAVFSSIDLEELSDPTQWGKDMTDDQKEKAQEVIVPVILVSNIISSVASALTRRV